MAAPTLLILDDSRFARLQLRKFVSALRPSWAIVEAGSVDEALGMLPDVEPDYFCVDLNMPERDGFDFIEALRRDRPTAPVVLVTANIQSSTEKRAAELDAAWLPKPLTEESARTLVENFKA